jgi:Molecular chaperone (small heat shock protein)
MTSALSWGWVVSTTLRPLLYYQLCDFYEAEENYCLSMELPGISKEDVDISMSGDSLVVKVKKSTTVSQKK